MSYLTRYVVEEVTEYFQTGIAPMYERIRDSNGFRYDSLERRDGPADKADVSILSRVGTAFLYFGDEMDRADYVGEAGAALQDLLKLQQPDGRWERWGTDDRPSLDEAFDTADAVQFCMHCVRMQRMDGLLLREAQDAALAGAKWLAEGEIAPMGGVEPGPPLNGAMSFEQANYTGSMIRALAMVGGKKWLDYAIEGATALCRWQLPCGSWAWYQGSEKVASSYHDLTMAGLCEVAAATSQLRFLCAVECGLAHVESMQQPNGLTSELWTTDGPSGMTHFSGLTSAAMAYGLTARYSQAAVRELATGLAWALIGQELPTGSTTYSVEARLVITRCLTDFVRVFG